MGLVGKRVGVTHVSLTGILRVPKATLGSLLHPLQVDSFMDRGFLLRDQQALLILSNALSPPGIAAKASQ